MNKDTLKGTFDKAKGDIKSAGGKLAGDSSLRVEGALDKVAGAVQKGAGEMKGKVEKVIKDLKK